MSVRRVTVLAPLVALAILATAGASPSLGAVTPIQVALIHPVQIFPAGDSVHGLRLNILYGVNKDMYGLDLGLVNRTTGTVKGVQWGYVDIADGDFEGWQGNGIVNITSKKFTGLQTGWVNRVGGGTGMQWGLINMSDSFHGFQLAVFNMTQTMHGLQIGVINVIQKKSHLPIFPIVNWSF